MRDLKNLYLKEKNQYDKAGYAIFRNVLDEGLIQEMRDHLEWLMKKNPNIAPEGLDTFLVNKDPFWIRVVSDDRLLDVAEPFIGQDIALFASHYICKPAGKGKAVLWHQDGSYWPLEPMEVVTLWVAVDDSLTENGCMRVIPGTQHLNLMELIKRDDVENVLGSGLDEKFVDESKAVNIVLKAGDVSVHHPNVIHGSNPNTSILRRCGLTIRYIPTRTKVTKDPERFSLFHLRGIDQSKTNPYLEFPKYIEGEHIPFKSCDAWV